MKTKTDPSDEFRTKGMRRLLTVLFACFLLSLAASANEAVQIPGQWSFKGSAIDFGDDDIYSNVAGKAVSSGMKERIDEYLQEAGIHEGSMTFSFNEDYSFNCTFMGIPLEGTWKTLDGGSRIQLQFGKKMNYLSMTGAVNGTSSQCCMLFEESRFLTFLRKSLSKAGKRSDALKSIHYLSGQYNRMQIGCSLEKD